MKPQVLITGAAGSLGQTLVKHALAQGASVVATYHRTSPPKDLESSARWIQVDMSSADDVAKKIPLENYAAWIHAAGSFKWVKVDESRPEDLEALLDSNLRSSFLLSRHLLPAFKKAGTGRIVFVSARATLQPTAGMGLYTASKAALNALVLAMADEVKSTRITINAVLPTIIDTPANRRDMPGADTSGWVSASDLAQFIWSLTEESSQMIHGALIPVSGRL